jgi:hypothetical protein
MKKTIGRTVFLAGIVLLFALPAIAQPLNTEQKKIKQVFFNFLQLYKKNAVKFNSFILYKGTGKDNNNPYSIQWKEVDKYFAYLRKSVPLVGEAYIIAERNHFKFSDSCFKADKEEIMPVGFDFDRWAGGQDDIEFLIKAHTSAKNKYEVKVTGNTAVLRIGQPLWEGAEEKDFSWMFVPFVKEKGMWKMADNIYPENREDE